MHCNIHLKKSESISKIPWLFHDWFVQIQKIPGLFLAARTMHPNFCKGYYEVSPQELFLKTKFTLQTWYRGTYPSIRPTSLNEGSCNGMFILPDTHSFYSLVLLIRPLKLKLLKLRIATHSLMKSESMFSLHFHYKKRQKIMASLSYLVVVLHFQEGC